MPRLKKTLLVEPVQKKWLSSREACRYLDCSDEYLKFLRDNALIGFSQPEGGNKRWYDIASIDKFLQKNRVI